MIMQGTHLLNQDRGLTIGEIKRGIEGNLCRCTGYKKVIEAISAAIRKTNGTHNSESPD